MDEHRDDLGTEGPRWVPYTPPAPDGWDRVRLFVRRVAFPALVLLLGLGVVGVVYWSDSIRGLGMSSAEDAGTPMETRSGSLAPGDRPPSAETQVTVYSSPSGATVRMNGDSVGVTPLVDRSVETGAYMVSLLAEGHFRADTVVVLQRARPSSITLTLRPRPGTQAAEESGVTSPPETDRSARAVPRTAVPTPTQPVRPDPTPRFGQLYVTSIPAGATVVVNGTIRGRTPLSVSELTPGTAQVDVSLDPYQSWTRQIDISPGATRRIHADLEPRTGRLRVLVRPWGTIYVNGQLHARERDIWYETTLPAGGHDVRVVHPVLGQSTRRVQVPAGADTSIVFDLRSD